jgi:tripartite-type tricarboxylate transporter receptor subunit TctC
MTRPNVRRSRRALVLLPVIGLLAAACGGGEEAPSGEQATGGGGAAPVDSCYEGETATFVVPFSPGGGYDTIARGLAPFLKDELGADAVVVQNMPGAGGLTAANSLYNEDPDGLTFGLFAAQGIVGSSIAGAAGASFDPGKFTYVARLAQDSRVLLASPKSGFTSVDDLEGAGRLQYATAGTGAADHVDANVLPTILGLDNVEVITGFEGSAETELAVTAGKVQLGSGTLGTRIGGIENGDQVPILLMGREPAEELPDVPALLELDLGDQQELAEAYVGLQEVGRSVFGPPEMEENCLTELQGALEATLSNPEFQEKIGGSVDVPFEYADGEELREAVDSVLNAPEELVTLLQQAYAGQ